MLITPNQILEEYWEQGVFPVNPYTIAQRMGVVVTHINNKDGGVIGKFIPASGDENLPRIEYDPEIPIIRQRFTIAHELGHFVLNHQMSFRDTSRNFNTNYYEPREVEANQFAANLLMPATYVFRFYLKDGLDTVESLAHAFGVSKMAMAIRIKQIGLI